MSAGEQIRFGLKWVAVSQVSVQAARFLSNVVLARLLVPEMFGMVAMASVSIQVLGVVREVGLGAAYVQRRTETPEEDRRAADTTFALSIAINALLFVGAWLASPAIAAYFRTPEVESVLRAMFAVFLLEGLATTPSLVLQKRLDFGRYATSEIITSVSFALISISCALFGLGVWALVAGHLGSKLLQVGVLYRISGWRPGRDFDWPMARELFSYGKYLWAFAVLSAVGGALDRALMGRWIGPAALGVYTIALNLSLLPTRQITSLVNRVSFPALATIQHDKPAMRRAVRRALAHVSVLSVPLGLGMAAVAPELIVTVYGERWSEAIPIVEVLAFLGVTLSVSAIYGPVFRAIGRPQLMLYTSLLHNALLLGLLFALRDYGVLGICFAVLIPTIVSAIIAFALVIHLLEFRTVELLEPLLRATLSAGGMYASVEVFQTQLPRLGAPSAPLALLLSVSVGVLAYLAFTAAVNRPMLGEFSTTLRQVLRARGSLS